MTFSVFAVLMIIIVLLVAFIHMLQGVFSAAISAVLAIFSAVMALSYHEVVVEKLLGGRMADSAHAMVLMVLFAAIYLVLRVVFDSVVPGNIRLPAMADKVGGAVLGAVAGVFGAGVVAVAAQEMSFFPAMMGYARYAVDSHEVTVPGRQRGTEATITDQMNSPDFNEADLQKMLLPVDDILVDTTKHLSEGGALASEPLTRMHPDWLKELFGQRLGIEPGARRVLINLPSAKAPEVMTDGVFMITEKELPWIDSDFGQLRGSSKQKGLKPKALPAAAPLKPGEIPSGTTKQAPEYYEVKLGTVLLVVRVRFNHDAAERNAGGLVRVSPGSTRLVLPTDGKPPGEATGYADNYPIGTLEYRDYRPEKGHPKLPHFIMIGQNVDDFIFVATEPDPEFPEINSESPGDGGVDFVFSVPQQQLGLKIAPGQTPDVARSDVKLPQGSFLEVKRLGRKDMGGEKIQPESALDKGWDSIRVLRKPDEIKTGQETLALVGGTGPAPDTTTPPTTPTPAAPNPTTPTPAAPNPAAPTTPTPAQPAAGFSLDVAEDGAKVSPDFFTQIGTGGAEGPVTVGGASFTLVKSEDKLLIQSVRADGVEPKALRSGGATQVKQLAPPAGMTLVQVQAKPREGAADKTWAWKDQLAGFALVGADNASYPLVGAWAQYTDGPDGSTKLSARYSADGSVPVNDLKPGGDVKSVWLVFGVKPGTKVQRLTQGGQPVKDLAVDVP